MGAHRGIRRGLRSTAWWHALTDAGYTEGGASFDVTIRQGSTTAKLLDHNVNGNGKDRVPVEVSKPDLERTYEAVNEGLVLVASL